MKKVIIVLLCLSLVLSLAACSVGRTEPPKTTEAQAAVPEEKPSEEKPSEGTPSEEKPSEGIPAENLAVPVPPLSPRREKYDESGWKVQEEAKPGSEYEDADEMIAAEIEEYEKIRRRLPDFYTSTIGEILGSADGKNTVYSPVNVYLALAMLAEITEGESRAQILSLLGAGTVEELRETAKTLWHSNYCDDGLTTLTLANSLWLDRSLSVRESTVQRLADDYYASAFRGVMGSPEINEKLQNWLNENTGHLLEESVGGVETKRETILALASAIYFKAAWMDDFPEEKTKQDEIFHSPGKDTRCDYLVSDESSAAFFTGEHFTAYCRPMEDRHSMWFVLPEEGMSPEELASDPELMRFLLSDPYETFEDKCGYYALHAEVPKFDVNSGIGLIEALQALGVTDVFDAEKADFSALLEEKMSAYVSEAQHAARVKIDEEGCEAAAYTVIMVDKAMYVEEPRADFILDRPFLFAVKGYSGALLFTGVVNEP